MSKVFPDPSKLTLGPEQDEKHRNETVSVELNYLDTHFDQVSNFEYLVFKYEKGEVHAIFNDRELEQILDVLFTYTFPMNTNPSHQACISALSETEEQEMDHFEKQFIQKILQKINPDLHILPIPKTFYQLFTAFTNIGFVLGHKQFSLFHKWSECDAIADTHYQKFSDILEASFATMSATEIEKYTKKYFDDAQSMGLTFCPKAESFYEDCHRYHSRSSVRAIWNATNAALLEAFKSQGTLIPTKSILLKIAELWFQTATQQLHDSERKPGLLARDKEVGKLSILEYQGHFQANKLLLIHIIEQEFVWGCDPKREGKYLIYRGSTTERDLAMEGNSISFSDGALAGFINDYQTGCAFYYMAEYQREQSDVAVRNAYRLLIDKEAYRRQQEDWQQVHIPPVCNLGRLAGLNELHHVRTKQSRDIGLTKGCWSDTASTPFLFNSLKGEDFPKIRDEFFRTRAFPIKDSSTLQDLVGKQRFILRQAKNLKSKPFMDDQDLFRHNRNKKSAHKP